jgi:uncharacterized protein with PQ loop repeat
MKSRYNRAFKSKKASSISVTLFVLMVFLVLIVVLYAISVKSAEYKKAIGDSALTENLYARSAELDYYIKNLVLLTDAKDSVNSFKDSLFNLKDAKGQYPNKDLKSLENQIDSKHIFTEKDMLIFNFSISLEDQDFLFEPSYIVIYTKEYYYDKKLT